MPGKRTKSKPQAEGLQIDLSRQPWYDEAARIRFLRTFGLYVLCAYINRGWVFVGAFRELSIAEVNEFALKESGVITAILEPVQEAATNA